MKTKITLLISLFILTLCLYSQNETVNQLDTNGKKDGKWIEYLDSTWKILKDTNQAIYYRYVYYEHGVKILPELYCTAKKRLEYIGDNNQDSKPVALNGEYKWYDKKRRLLSYDCYKDGEHLWGKNYRWGLFNKKLTGTKTHEYYDYTIHYNNQPQSAYYECYDKKGNVRKFHFMKDFKGWAAYEQ